MKELSPDRRPMLNTTEVAEMFSVSRPLLYKWIADGSLAPPIQDPETGWKLWQQADLDAVYRLVKTLRAKQQRTKKKRRNHND